MSYPRRNGGGQESAKREGVPRLAVRRRRKGELRDQIRAEEGSDESALSIRTHRRAMLDHEKKLKKKY